VTAPHGWGVNDMPTSRQSRSLLNSAWNSLGQAEAFWVRFVHSVEALGGMHGDVEVGTRARNLAQQMHEFREVLTTWSQE
jgi:hypothetical protein